MNAIGCSRGESAAIAGFLRSTLQQDGYARAGFKSPAFTATVIVTLDSASAPTRRCSMSSPTDVCIAAYVRIRHIIAHWQWDERVGDHDSRHSTRGISDLQN